jgi:photosystem II stability/assembly factor-like uncharacterized protein
MVFLITGCHPKPYSNIEGKREFFEEYPAWRKPELAVTNLSIEPERIDPGDSVSLLAAVSNIGADDTCKTTLVFTLDGLEIKRFPIAPLRPSDVTLKRHVWSVNTPGRHKARAHLKLGKDCVDWLVKNNFKDATVRVSGEENPIPELEFEIAIFDTLQFIPGKSYTIPIIVHNPSFAHISNIPIMFYIDSDLVMQDMIRSLEPDERMELRIPWQEVTPGEHMVTAKIDLSDEFQDNKKQNIRSWHVIVPDRTVLFKSPQKDKWASIGPRIIDKGWVGRMDAIAFHPIYQDTIYAGGGGKGNPFRHAAGIWKTENGCASWLPIGDKLDSMVISAIAVDPKNPDIIYVGTGDEFSGAGIFKSTDGGKKWYHFASNLVARRVSKIVVRYPKPDEVMIFAATNRGVLRYKSNYSFALTSDFNEWDVIKSGNVRDLAVHPTNHSIVFASIEDDGLYRTKVGENAIVESSPTNHNWTKMTNGLPSISRDDRQSLTVDIHKKYPNILFAMIQNPEPDIRYALYLSTDLGGPDIVPPDSEDSWKLVQEYAAGELDGGLYNPYIRIHPDSLHPYITLYFGGQYLYKWIGSLDTEEVEGKTFIVSGIVNMKAGVDMKALEFHPEITDAYFSLGDQGVYKCKIESALNEYNNPKNIQGKMYYESRDECKSRNNDLRVTQFYDFDVSATDPNLIIGGTQDTGNILFEGDIDWKFLHIENYGDGYYSLIAHNDPKIMYAQFQSLDSTMGTVDGWQSWYNAHTGLPHGYGSSGYIAHDPDLPGNLLAVGNQVYYTYDGGKSWEGVGPNDTKFNGPVTRVAIQNRGNRFVWVAGTENGQLWILNKPHTYFSSKPWKQFFERDGDPAQVQSIAFSHSDPDVFYVAFDGGSDSERIYRFKMYNLDPVSLLYDNVTYNLPPSIKPNVIAGDPNEPFVAYLGTNKGVWRWELQTESIEKWCHYNTGLPLTNVTDLLPVPQTGSIIAATYGRGAWSVITGP